MKRFHTQITLRTIALAATLALAVWLLSHPALYVPAALAGALAAYQTFAQIRYVERTNRELGRWLRSIRYSDFSQRFTDRGLGGSFVELGEALTGVMDEFRAARAETEESHRYLQTVMQHIGIGLLSFTEDGSVHLVNTAAIRLLRVPHLKHVQALDSVSPELARTLLRLRNDEKALVRIVEGDVMLQLSVYVTEFRQRGQSFKLVSLQDIQRELEEMEIEAWRKLTRVLTHEIMNSVAPIASLAATASELIQGAEATVLSDGASETLDDVRGAVQTIERRSEGLLHFVNAYRSLTRVPIPNFEIFPARELLDNVAELLGAALQARGIRIEHDVTPENLDLTADPRLLEQVLINLVKNAMEALEETTEPLLQLKAFLDPRGRAVVQVIDNGHGIVEEAIDKVFIPFFTTRKEGSGIGLSLSREIVRQHGGSLSVTSTPHQQTTFTVRL